MTMIDRPPRILSPEQLAEWTPAHRRMYARRLPKSWPRVERMLAESERAMKGEGDDPEPRPRPQPKPPAEEPGGAPEPTETPPEAIAPGPDVPLVFGDTFKPGRPQVRIAEILAACARCAMISMSEIRSQRRARTIVRPRQAAIYLATKHTDKSLPEIGRRVGGRDHSTVLHARRRVQADLDAGGEIFGAIVGQVERELGLL
jgi:hypothetical protein